MTIEIHTTSEPVSIGINTTSQPVSVGLNPQEIPVVSIGTNPILGPTGNGIESITKTSTSGLIDTYTITYTYTSPTTFTVTNGSSISSITKTSTSGLVDTYTITLTDGTISTFTVTNGEKGDTGNSGVQVSTTQPTDPDINVWLNPDGIVGNVSAFVNDGDGTSPFATQSYVDTYGGKIDLIKRNNVDLPIENKIVNITVPTDTSDLTNGAGFITSAYHDSSKQDVISDLSTIRTNATNGQSAYTTISGYGNIVTHNTSEFATSAQGAKADTAVQPSGLGNGVLTIQLNGSTVNTFSANQSSNVIANIPLNKIVISTTEPSDADIWLNPDGTVGNVSQFTNDAGYITSSYHDNTKYDASNPDGYTSNTGTITGITMNGASKGTSGVIDLGTVITSHQDISGKENISNKVTSISSSSTNTQYPSAKCVYDIVGNIEATLQAIRGV